MSVISTSTTDTPEQVSEALAAYGYTDNATLEVIESAADVKPVIAETPSEQAEPEKPASETAPAPDAEDDQQEPAKAEPEKAEPEKAEPESKPKGKENFQKRINELTSARRTAESENAELRRQLAELAAPEKVTPAVEPAKAEEAPNKPKVEDFSTYEDFTEALADFKATQIVDKRIAQIEAQNQQKAAEAEHTARVDAYVARLDDARTRIPDFDEVVGTDDIKITAAMHEVLMDSEAGADLAYWLGKNPAEAAKIAKLAPIQAARALGKVEASLSVEATPAPETPKPKAVSAAPAPVRPVSTKSASAGKDPETMNPAEYRRWRDNGGGKR